MALAILVLVSDLTTKWAAFEFLCVDRGTVSQADRHTLTDTSRRWTRDEHRGATVYVWDKERQRNENALLQRIAANDADTLAIVPPWGEPPHAGQPYRIERTMRAIPHILNFQISRNRGAVFGLGQGMTALLIAFTIFAGAAIVWAQWRYGRSSRLLSTGLGLLLGGAIGNLYDRLLFGSVRDFIDLYFGSYHWHTFNIADAAICVGCGFVILFSFRKPPEGQETAKGNRAHNSTAL